MLLFASLDEGIVCTSSFVVCDPLLPVLKPELGSITKFFYIYDFLRNVNQDCELEIIKLQLPGIINQL